MSKNKKIYFFKWSTLKGTAGAWVAHPRGQQPMPLTFKTRALLLVLFELWSLTLDLDGCVELLLQYLIHVVRIAVRLRTQSHRSEIFYVMSAAAILK